MIWLPSWLNARKSHTLLSEAESSRLASLRKLPRISPHTALSALRWVVVDVETGGLNPHHDPLLSIGAVEICDRQIHLGTGFESRLQQQSVSSHANILVHGLTHSQQLSGRAASDVLLDFAEFAGNAPRIAFHAAFDRTVLQGAMQKQLGWDFPGIWLDAAVIAPLLFPDQARHCRHLDDWLALFKLGNDARHNAVADALATAQFWLVLLQTAQAQHITTLKALERLIHARKWLSN